MAQCYIAGVRVIMFTGNYPVTAMHSGREIGSKNCEMVITGQQLEQFSVEELAERIKR